MADRAASSHVDPDRRRLSLERRRELFLFLFLAVVIWPVLAVGFVGGYGFLVWMYQLFVGPPGPPAI